jgi:integrase
MGLYKRGGIYWYRFVWNGELIRESTRQTNKRVAQQMEAPHRASLAKGEVGIRERKAAPTLQKFMEADFLPFVRTTKASKPNTVRFYENSVASLTAYSKLSSTPLDQITAEQIAGFVAFRQSGKVQVATINRDLATLRRLFNLAVEWGKVTTILPRARLLGGENHRERVLSFEEERKYLESATDLGHQLTDAYARALQGIRAVKRGEQPRQPDDLLRHVATLLIDCALRPEECFRLKWQDSTRDGAIEIHTGTGRGSRRRIPASKRVLDVLEMRRASATSEGFPGTHQERPHRRVHVEKTACRGAKSLGRRAPRALHLPAHLYHAVGQAHGSVHAPRPGRPHRHEHDEALRPSERGGHPGGDGESATWPGKARGQRPDSLHSATRRRLAPPCLMATSGQLSTIFRHALLEDFPEVEGAGADEIPDWFDHRSQLDWDSSGAAKYNSIRSVVQVATPQPKKSVSSVQMGQRRVSAAASTGQSSSSRCLRRDRAISSNCA